jgi:hypothetical protein
MRTPRQDKIAAAVVAYNAAGQLPLLTPDTERLLAVMFAEADVCQRNLNSFASEGFSRPAVTRLVRLLVEAGFVSKTPGVSRVPTTYQLHLPPLVRR